MAGTETRGVKKWLGLDLVDTLVHVGVTVCFLAFVEFTKGPEPIYPVATGISILIFGIRRKFALRKAARDEVRDSDRMIELEERVNYLEGLQDRVVELEERLDFTERLLARKDPERLSAE